MEDIQQPLDRYAEAAPQMPLTPDWNKERLETLKSLFPDLFTVEGKLNTDELKKLIDPQSINETERYEFRWFGKSQAKRNAFTPSNATLVFDEKRSVNPDQAENLIIEGENLEVLKLLSSSYREKVKCIYIDPPYNTGKDFVYSDNFTQDKRAYWEDAGITEEGVKIDTNTETDGRYHSNWLNMMYSRLLVARQLLKPDGVIFISIDDDEVHHLRKLCDEIFGEDSFIACLTWEKGRKNDSRFFSIGHEYIMVYAKEKELIKHVALLVYHDQGRTVALGDAVTCGGQSCLKIFTIPAGLKYLSNSFSAVFHRFAPSFGLLLLVAAVTFSARLAVGAFVAQLPL